MTRKRFVADNEYVMQNEEVYVVCGGKHSADVVATALNESLDEIEQLKKENNELRQDNDIKFWKLQCMHYFNSNSLFMSEISRAMRKGYKVSDKFQEYLDELEEDSKKIKEKNERLFGDD